MDEILCLSWFSLKPGLKKDLDRYSKTGLATDDLIKKYNEFKQEIKRALLDLKREGAFCIDKNHKDFPVCLKKAPYCPLVLSYKGEISLLKKIKYAFVGSRRIDEELKLWISSAFGCLKANVTLVSGGATGVDQEVQKAAARLAKPFLCVLPTGLLRPYPESLSFMMRKSYKTELYISIFHPYQSVRKFLFYPRNHVLAALSDKVFVLQAREKSGTMVTVKYAMDLGKEIYALPASPWDKRYGGNLKILEEGAYQITNLDLLL